MGEKKKKGSISYAKWGYIFIAPFFIIFAVFQLIPLASTIYYSFFEYYRSGLKIIGPSFVGLKNYITLFATDLPKYFSNTLILWIIGFIPQIAVSLLLAAWFTDLRLKLKGQTFFKTVICSDCNRLSRLKLIHICASVFYADLILRCCIFCGKFNRVLRHHKCGDRLLCVFQLYIRGSLPLRENFSILSFIRCFYGNHLAGRILTASDSVVDRDFIFLLRFCLWRFLGHRCFCLRLRLRRFCLRNFRLRCFSCRRFCLRCFCLRLRSRYFRLRIYHNRIVLIR